jgi:hypothetical protein
MKAVGIKMESLLSSLNQKNNNNKKIKPEGSEGEDLVHASLVTRTVPKRATA